MKAKKIDDEKQLKIIANQIRQDIISMLTKAASGHSAGPLGMADVFTGLYFNVLKQDQSKPGWDDRDIFILSNGHICPVLYATLANAGYFSREELQTLRRLGTRLQGHPHRLALPGIETSSGPLGCGISQACGAAIAFKMDKKSNRIYCVTGDGEHDEGNVWEAVLFAGKMRLNNITVIIDRNNIQIDGHTEEVLPLEPLRDKYESFGWHVIDVDGHNIRQIIDALEEAKSIFEKPTCVIAHTIPGKGVSFMENDPDWHGKPPTPEQAEVALKELQVWREAIEKGED